MGNVIMPSSVFARNCAICAIRLGWLTHQILQIMNEDEKLSELKLLLINTPAPFVIIVWFSSKTSELMLMLEYWRAWEFFFPLMGRIIFFAGCYGIPDSKAHGANMGHIWVRQNPGLGPMLAPWALLSGIIFEWRPWVSREFRVYFSS